ncbi:DUF5947 family protein [Actinokineospora sp.]|uniref:DUF5947 family protein n=1 Tax=Actinokineospora sp. TaxID=1872133 RepID=UPI0040381ABC
MTSGLRRFRTRPEPVAVPQAGERCEMCAEPISTEHGHVTNIETRALMCACRGCYLLFTARGAGGSKFRAVPERHVYAESLPGGAPLWDSAGIPVRMAFFFANSDLEKTVAFYPSPAGATESLLALDSWTELVADNAWLSDLVPDVEALLIIKQDQRFEGFLVPISCCYELVGLVRMHWRGFDGGTEAWAKIDGFFAALRARSTAAGSADA